MSALSRRNLLAGAALPLLAAAPVRLPKKVRVAVWGLDGHKDEIRRPLAGYPDVEMVGVQDADEKAAMAFAKGAPAFTDARRMLDALKPDVVAVCNNDGERAGAVLECLRRKLHVIAEKPLALNRHDLDQIKKELPRSGAKLGMLLPLRMTPPFLALRAIVESGQIGEVIQISSQKSYKLGERPVWQQRKETYGSTILWIGIHMFDLMRFTSRRDYKAVAGFMGAPGTELRAGAMETTTTSSFQLDNGGTATLHMDYCRPEKAPTHEDDRVRLAGTKGVAEYMAATGVTLMTASEPPRRITELPAAGSIFGEFLEWVYLDRPTLLPHAEILHLCDVTVAAHEAAVTGRIVRI